MNETLLTTKRVSQIFAITTNIVGWAFILTAMALFSKYGFIYGGAFFLFFGICLVMVSIVWLIIEQKREVQNNVRNK